MPNNVEYWLIERRGFALRQAAHATRIVQGHLSVLRAGQHDAYAMARSTEQVYLWARTAAHWGLIVQDMDHKLDSLNAPPLDSSLLGVG